MTKLQYKHAGIILAAGASSRMGQPKARLESPSGAPRALYQAEWLRSAGVDAVDDPAIRNNGNTQEEREKLKTTLNAQRSKEKAGADRALIPANIRHS